MKSSADYAAVALRRRRAHSSGLSYPILAAPPYFHKRPSTGAAGKRQVRCGRLRIQPIYGELSPSQSKFHLLPEPLLAL